jgi:hypothetical protein
MKKLIITLKKWYEESWWGFWRKLGFAPLERGEEYEDPWY